MFEYLHWQTDPLLIDPTPVEQNRWLTANDLFREGKEWLIFSPTGQFQLYSLMLRKVDFTTGERLLQGFPYILLEKDWCEKLRKQTLSLAERAHHYFEGSIGNFSIRSWQKKYIQYLEEQKRLPFPLFRLADEWQDYFVGKDYICFQSARGEDFQLPLTFSEELAYLLGVIMGDGHLADYFVNIIDSSKEHIENLARLLDKHFHSKIELFEQQNANAWNVNILGKWIVRFFNFLSSQPINERKYPYLCQPIISRNDILLSSAFWRGIMDADGSYKTTISFGTASKQLLEDFSQFLQYHNITFRFYEQEVFGGITYSFNIAGKSRKEFSELLGSSHPQKQLELQKLIMKKTYHYSPRINTLLQHGTWKGQILDFKKEKLVDGFFNFSFCRNLSVCEIGDFIRNIRINRNEILDVVAKNLSITPSRLSKYELNKTAIPILLLYRIFSHYQIHLKDFYVEYPKLLFRISNTTCKFPSQPSDILLDLLHALKLHNNGYFLIIDPSQNSLEYFTKELSDFFAIPIIEKRRIQNSILRNLVQEFCLVK